MEKKQSAVDWLVEQVNSSEYQKAFGQTYISIEIIEQAKEMEKEQMFDFAKAFYRYASGPDSGAVYDEDIQRFCDKYWTK